MTSSARVAPASCSSARTRAVGVVVAQVVRGQRPSAAEELERGPALVGHARRAWSASSSGSRSTPSTRTARSQVRWLSPTCSSSTRSGATPKRAANRRWNPIATLHSPIARWPASSSAWVTIPTGFVKSTIQASGRAPPADLLGQLEDDRARSAAPWRSRPGRSSPGRCSRTDGGSVSSVRRAAWPPTRSWTRTNVGAVERGGAVGRRRSAGPASRCRRRIRSASPATIASRSASMSWRTSSSTGRRRRAIGQALDELRGVGAAAADDGDLQAHRPPSPRSSRAGRSGLDNRAWPSRLVITLSATVPVRR